MSEYLYLASNPSMPGLVKVGRTSTSPKARMAALHTTGVATPFTLEFVARVPDSAFAEKCAHAALDRFRVVGNREFFRVGASEAVRRVLEAIGAHEIDWDHTKRRPDVEKLQTEFAHHRDRKVAERQACERTALEKANAWEKWESEVKQRLTSLGPKPPLPEKIHPFVHCLRFAFFPVPVGLWLWMGMLTLSDPKHSDIGVVCAVLVSAGLIAHLWMNGEEARHKKLVKPWDDLEDALRKHGPEMQSAKKDLESARAALHRVKSWAEGKAVKEPTSGRRPWKYRYGRRRW